MSDNLDLFTAVCLKHLQGKHNQKRHGWRYGSDYSAFNNTQARQRMTREESDEFKKRYEDKQKYGGRKLSQNEKKASDYIGAMSGSNYTEIELAKKHLESDLKTTYQVMRLEKVTGQDRPSATLSRMNFDAIKSSGGTAESYLKWQQSAWKSEADRYQSALSGLTGKLTSAQRQQRDYLKTVIDNLSSDIKRNDDLIAALSSIK